MNIESTLPASRKRQRRSPEQWQDILSQFYRSGLTAQQFCKKYGIGYASLCKWRQRLAHETSSNTQTSSLSPTPTFIDLGTLKSPPCATASPWHIVLKLGNGVELCLSQGIDPSVERDHVSP